MSMAQLIAELSVSSKSQMASELTRAVQLAAERASDGEQGGILVTRHSYSRFTVALSSEVPFGTIIELDSMK